MSLARSSPAGSLLAPSPLFLTRVLGPEMDPSTRYALLTLSGAPQVCLALIRRTLRLLNASKLSPLPWKRESRKQYFNTQKLPIKYDILSNYSGTLILSDDVILAGEPCVRLLYNSSFRRTLVGRNKRCKKKN